MKKLNILLGVYPDLFFRTGGLQNQMLTIQKELNKAGHNALLFFEYFSNPIDVDIYHHFSIEPDSCSIFNEGKKLAKRTVLSPVFNHQMNIWYKSAVKISNKVLPFSVLGYKERKHIWNNSDAAVFLAEKERSLVNGYVGFRQINYRIIPNGISEAFAHAPAALQEDQNNEEKYLLHIGGIYPLKNQKLSIEVAKNLNIHLVIIGPILNELYYNDLQKYAQSINASVSFRHPLPNSSEEYINLIRNAQVVVLPSKSEVFPFAVIESLALGTPVVCTDNCFLYNEYFKNSSYIKFRSCTSDSFSSAVKTIIGEQVRAQNSASISEQFQWSIISGNLVKFYNEILE